MIKFKRQNVLGETKYIDNQHHLSACKVNNRWFVSKNHSVPYSASFVNIKCAENFFNSFDEIVESLNMLGYCQDEFDKFKFNFPQNDDEFVSEVYIIEDGNFKVITSAKGKYDSYTTDNFDWLAEHILSLQEKCGIDSVESIEIKDPSDVKASITSKDITKRMVRVKSSNVWSYTIDIRDNKSKTGTVYVQFKKETGGPGDIYCYYDVPIKIWHRILSATSKGHAVWKFLRNNFLYSKLTGDKRGKLKNAVNNNIGRR